jgi:methionyl-tRNA formyltransferase
MDKLKEVLIISDNPFLAERFEKEVWTLVYSSSYNLSFGCSPYSNTADFNLSKPISKIDLKNSEDLNAILGSHLILSIHCKQLFPEKLVNTVRCVNVHPGYNPINRGWYPQVFAIIENLDIGATIHEIDKHLDNGKIIVREKVQKYEDDTSLSLYNRITNKEIELLKFNIESILNNTYQAFLPELKGTLRLKKDFNKLLQIDLDEKLTMGEAINRLRALTHGAYKNAYYFNKIGDKIYISLNIDREKGS